MEKYDVIVIGAGAAGMSAAVYAIRKKLSVAILAPEIGGQTALALDIENYLGFPGGAGRDLVEEFKKHLNKFSEITQKIGERVAKLEKKDNEFYVSSDSGKTYQGKAVIITSGRVPRHLGIPGEEEFYGKGVTYCSICDGPLFGGKEVAVIGGGNAALDTAVFMTKIATKVYVLSNGPRFAGDPVTIEKLEKDSKVELITNADTKQILGEGFVSGLKYVDKNNNQEKEIAIKGVLVEIGSIPSAEFFRGLIKTTEMGEIEIDQFNKTNQEGIFAAGDVTSVPYKQTIIAAGEGAKAALSAYEYVSKKSAAGTTH